MVLIKIFLFISALPLSPDQNISVRFSFATEPGTSFAFAPPAVKAPPAKEGGGDAEEKKSAGEEEGGGGGGGGGAEKEEEWGGEKKGLGRPEKKER